ncbi:fructoselysine 3-epimerase [Dethiothermospora halolimnae]|uniref:fructoselysine 3-epimerase n=1 Tax=Dethiothermospora halolimnae TaxID=3114390 RepID=UPI003CCBF3B1
MEIGMFTSGYQRNSLKEVFKDGKRFGYDFIELWGARPHGYPFDLKDGSIDEIKELIQRYEIPIKGYTPEMNAYPYNMMIGTESMRKDSIDYIKLSMDMAKELGAEFTLISAGHAGYKATTKEIWDRLIKCIKEIADYAEKIQHTVVLEPLTPYESNVVTTANDLAQVFRMVSSPYLVGMCDVVAPYVQYESIMTYFDKLGDKMYHMHIVDSDGSSDNHIMPKEGKMPLKELIMELKEINYDKTMTIELVTSYINEPSLYSRRAITNLKSLLTD